MLYFMIFTPIDFITYNPIHSIHLLKIILNLHHFHVFPSFIWYFKICLLIIVQISYLNFILTSIDYNYQISLIRLIRIILSIPFPIIPIILLVMTNHLKISLFLNLINHFHFHHLYLHPRYLLIH